MSGRVGRAGWRPSSVTGGPRRLRGRTRPPDAARPVTEEESQTLALVRFNNFDAGARRMTATLDDRGHELTLDGWVDYTDPHGARTAQRRRRARPAAGLGRRLRRLPPDDLTGAPAVPADLGGWDATALDAQATPLHALLIVLASLGADRPENPLLLQQGGALWLRDDTMGDRPVAVFTVRATLPSSTVSSIRTRPRCATGSTADGLLMRVEVRLGATWATVDFGTPSGATVPKLFDDVVPAP